MTKTPLFLAAIFIAFASPRIGAEVAHPFIWLTSDEAAEIRQRVETDPQAKKQLERMGEVAEDPGKAFWNLFQYQVFGNEAAGNQELKNLLTFIGTDPVTASEKLLHGGRHLANYLDVLRYDVLYDMLSPEQRADIQKTFRVHIDHFLKDKKEYTRTSWLPNMQWPRPISAHLMALALQDKDLIKAVFEANGGWKYYFDDYLADGRFYMEEFGKQYSMIGEMFFWCRGLDRLGLPQFGYDYTGKGGANMKRFMQGLLDLTYPRVEIPDGMPHYPRITQGDKRAMAPFPHSHPAKAAFQHATVPGFLPAQPPSEERIFWSNAQMNGLDHRSRRIPKMGPALWYELAHQKWPDAGFDYFLAQFRDPGESVYLPTLYFGLAPIDMAGKPPAPPAAPSWVAPERGIALLRMDESPRYWESPSPALAVSMSRYYVHSKPDSFSILGLYAFNRPIYLGRAFGSNAYTTGPYFSSSRSHLTVTVDNLPGEFSDRGAAIAGVPFTERHVLDDAAKFFAVRSNRVFPGVDQERALVLTDSYVLDLFQLTSSQPRTFQWQIQALGLARPDAGQKWTPSEGMHHSQLFDLQDETVAADPRVLAGVYDPKDVQALAAGNEDWSLKIQQDFHAQGDRAPTLPQSWYDRKIGVRIWMLGGDEETTVYHGRTPYAVFGPAQGKEPEGFEIEPEVGGVTVMVERKAPSTIFEALHAFYQNGDETVTGFSEIPTDAPEARCYRIALKGGGIDYIGVRLGNEPQKEASFEIDGRRGTFTGFGMARMRDGQTTFSGNMQIR